MMGWARMLACADSVPEALPSPTLALSDEVGLLAGDVVGVGGSSLVVRGCGGEALVDPVWSTWAMPVERSATPCVLTLFDGERLLGGKEVHPGYGPITLCALRPSLGVVVRREEGHLVVVADHHPDATLRPGDLLVGVGVSESSEQAIWAALAKQRPAEEVVFSWRRDGLRDSAPRAVVSACDDPVAPQLWRGDGGPPITIDRAPLSTTLF